MAIKVVEPIISLTGVPSSSELLTREVKLVLPTEGSVKLRIVRLPSAEISNKPSVDSIRLPPALNHWYTGEGAPRADTFKMTDESL